MAIKIKANANVLITDDKYVGKYVALKDFNDNKVCGSGDTPNDAYKEAIENGCSNPIIIFATPKDVTYVF